MKVSVMAFQDVPLGKKIFWRKKEDSCERAVRVVLDDRCYGGVNVDGGFVYVDPWVTVQVVEDGDE